MYVENNSEHSDPHNVVAAVFFAHKRRSRTRIVHRESGITFVLIPAGRFQMGSPASEPQRSTNERQHWRVIKEPFYIAETEVTVEQFRRFVKATNYLTDAERGAEEGGHTKGAFATVPDGDREWNASASWKNPFPNLTDFKHARRSSGCAGQLE